MQQIKIKDANFVHNKTGTTSPVFQSSEIQWLRGIDDTETVVFTDLCLNLVHMVDPNLKKVAWILEPRDISGHVYSFIEQHSKLFDTVVTFDQELLDKIDNGKFCPFGGSWIPLDQWMMHDKQKVCSLIASAKNNTTGHRLRHRVASKYKDKIDLYGSAYRHVAEKTEALNNYMFSVAIENCRRDSYFTEKLIDCFATHTVPIYWGCPSIARFFNPRGMIIFEEFNQLEDIIPALGGDLYNSMADALSENHEIAKRYRVAEDYLGKYILCDLP